MHLLRMLYRMNEMLEVKPDAQQTLAVIVPITRCHALSFFRVCSFCGIENFQQLFICFMVSAFTSVTVLSFSRIRKKKKME